MLTPQILARKIEEMMAGAPVAPPIATIPKPSKPKPRRKPARKAAPRKKRL